MLKSLNPNIPQPSNTLTKGILCELKSTTVVIIKHYVYVVRGKTAGSQLTGSFTLFTDAN